VIVLELVFVYVCGDGGGGSINDNSLILVFHIIFLQERNSDRLVPEITLDLSKTLST
jgi:hypothetical protein